MIISLVITRRLVLNCRDIFWALHLLYFLFFFDNSDRLRFQTGTFYRYIVGLANNRRLLLLSILFQNLTSFLYFLIFVSSIAKCFGFINRIFVKALWLVYHRGSLILECDTLCTIRWSFIRCHKTLQANAWRLLLRSIFTIVNCSLRIYWSMR